MKQGTKDTIRRKPDYERDPDWDTGKNRIGQKRALKHAPLRTRPLSEDAEYDDGERTFPDSD